MISREGLKNNNPENQTKNKKKDAICGTHRVEWIVTYDQFSHRRKHRTGACDTCNSTPNTISVAMNVPAGKRITFPQSQCTENKHFICFYLILEFLSCFSILEQNAQGGVHYITTYAAIKYVQKELQTMQKHDNFEGLDCLLYVWSSPETKCVPTDLVAKPTGLGKLLR